MRLLKTKPSPSLLPDTEEFFGDRIPRYAILSHTWFLNVPELLFQHLIAPTALPADLHKSLAKVTSTCRLARDRDHLDYAWVDTCCIDKTNQVELAEAIASMYAWYRDAEVCYVFLEDLAPGANLVEALPRCRWFTRGWTLQELLAPREVVFFDSTWKYRGDKRGLAGLLSSITRIPEALLRGEAGLGEFAVARRMAWAAGRQTTRVEDLAYCLLGIFDVNMPLLYGEGMKAFARLQTAILLSTGDLSLLAWVDKSEDCPEIVGMLAQSPRQFADCDKIETVLGDSSYADFALTTKGIRTAASQVLNQRADVEGSWRVALNTFCCNKGELVGVCVRKIGGGVCARTNPGILVSLGSAPFRLPRPDHKPLWTETLTLATALPAWYPFYSGLNPVLGKRCSAIRVDWGPLAVNDYRVVPRGHWDPHDRVFFCCNPSNRGWCGLFVSGKVNPESTENVPETLFLACSEWNRGTPRVLLASLDSLDPVTRIFLEFHLDQVKFESIRRFEALTNAVFPPGSRVEEESISTEFGEVKFLRDSTAAAAVTVHMRRELVPDVCVNPVVILDILPRCSRELKS